MKSKTVYMPPQAKIIILKDFDLSKIEEVFQYADFERRISKQKVHKIVHVVLDNKFTDNVLCLVPSSGPVKYDVIDGSTELRDCYAKQLWDMV